MNRCLLSIDQLTDDEIDWVITRAGLLAAGAPAAASPLVGLIFLSESTRTRCGFEAAAHRLGGGSIHLSQNRDGAVMSAAESFEDSLRTLSGMVDVVVTRVPFDLDSRQLAPHLAGPLLSGGHGEAEHPSQALIDFYAMVSTRGPVSELSVAICGDLTMRATRSLLKLFDRRPPASLRLIAPDGRRDHGVDFSPALAAVTQDSAVDDLAGVDVLYLPGLPARRDGVELGPEERLLYAATAATLELLASDAVILCPLPAIDEVQPAVREDSRLRMFQQSDSSVFVRMAMLELVLT